MEKHSSLPARQPASESDSSRSNPPHRILVVDDDTAIRRLSTHLLNRSGYAVDNAADGAAAWQALSDGNYDLLVTDHDMPKLSGLELVKQVRAARMALPIILMSGVMPTEELNLHPWLKIEATLNKPFSPAQLLGTVKELLRTNAGA